MGAASNAVRFERVSGSAIIDIDGKTILKRSGSQTDMKILPHGKFQLMAGHGTAGDNQIKLTLLPVWLEPADVPWQKLVLVSVPMTLSKEEKFIGSLHGSWPKDPNASSVHLSFQFTESSRPLWTFGGGKNAAFLKVTSNGTTHLGTSDYVDLAALIPGLPGDHKLETPRTVSVLRQGDSESWDVQLSIELGVQAGEIANYLGSRDIVQLLIKVEGLAPETRDMDTGDEVPN